jgi:hypothetical protein
MAAFDLRGRSGVKLYHYQKNIDFFFNAITTDKPIIGAGSFFIPILDPGSTTTNWGLESGDYFITMRSDAGIFRESLKLTVENNQLRQHIRILNDEDVVIYEGNMP